jgi:general secretion pathway protein B
MSFILDALKKSESERQRQSGPALFEVKVAPPRHRFAVWAIALGALLAINLVVVGWMLSRGSSARRVAVLPAAVPRPALATASSPVAPSSPFTAPAPAPTSVPAAASGARALEPGGATATPNAGAPSAGAAAPAGSARLAAVGSAGGAAVAGGAVAGGAASGAAGGTPVNPGDLAPAVEPSHGTSQPASGAVVAGETESGLPTYQDAAAAPGADIPPLQLELHVYDPRPDRRFVLLNMMKLQEGDSLPQGVRVDRITLDGVILSYRGTRFVMQRATDAEDRGSPPE